MDLENDFNGFEFYTIQEENFGLICNYFRLRQCTWQSPGDTNHGPEQPLTGWIYDEWQLYEYTTTSDSTLYI